jgi:HicA toxin of bacterial toxin-antitoxin,
MGKPQKTLAKILAGSKNIAFKDMVSLVEAFGFSLNRINGSHHIFQHPVIDAQLNLQNKDGQAKAYQVRQFMRLVEGYNLTIRDEPSQES